MNRRVAPIPLSLVLLAAIEPAAGAGLDPGPPARVVAADGPDRAARQPQVAVDEAGRVFVAFGVGDTIRCAASADGGRTFEARTVGSAGVLALGMRRGPRIAAAGKTVVVTAVCGTEGKGRDGDLLAWRSADAGRTWAGPARVNSIAGSAREGLHGMAGGPGGAVFCTWLDLRDKGSQIYGARSRDGGATWEPDRLIYRAPGGKVCECCHPSAALAPDGTVCVMWRNQLEGARDLYLARSADGGRSFGPAEKLGRGTWLLNACPMDGGAVAVGPDGAVESAWTRAGAVYLARPGAAEHRLGPGVQGWIAAGPGGPFVVWLAGRPGRLLAQLPGRPRPATLAEDAADPAVAAGPGGRGPVVAVWEAKESDGGIYAATLAPAGEAPAPRHGTDASR